MIVLTMKSFHLTIKKFEFARVFGSGQCRIAPRTVLGTILVIMRLREKLVEADASPKTTP